MKLNSKKILSLLFVFIMLLFAVASFGVNADQVNPGQDSDGDGLTDTEEDTNGDGNYTEDVDKSDLNDPDTDGDGLIDSDDKDPTVPNKKYQYSKEEWDKKNDQESLLNTFLFVLLMSFAIFSLVAGIFTAYFGAGKSRAIGGVLLILGLVVILVWVYFTFMSSYPDDTILGLIHWEAARTLEAFVTVLGAIVGAVVAIVLFLVAIMKS
jgi:hypothetical protein